MTLPALQFRPIGYLRFAEPHITIRDIVWLVSTGIYTYSMGLRCNAWIQMLPSHLRNVLWWSTSREVRLDTTDYACIWPLIQSSETGCGLVSKCYFIPSLRLLVLVVCYYILGLKSYPLACRGLSVKLVAVKKLELDPKSCYLHVRYMIARLSLRRTSSTSHDWHIYILLRLWLRYIYLAASMPETSAKYRVWQQDMSIRVTLTIFNILLSTILSFSGQLGA